VVEFEAPVEGPKRLSKLLTYIRPIPTNLNWIRLAFSIFIILTGGPFYKRGTKESQFKERR
jgi:hypothetical protein